MSTRCDKVQDALLDGLDALDHDGKAHLEECPNCSTVAAALDRVDQSLASLPPIDPPAGLVERTHAALPATAVSMQADPAPPTVTRAFWKRHARLFETGIAAALLIALVGLVTPNLLNSVQRGRHKRAMSEVAVAKRSTELFRQQGAAGKGQQAPEAPAASRPHTYADAERDENLPMSVVEESGLRLLEAGRFGKEDADATRVNEEQGQFSKDDASVSAGLYDAKNEGLVASLEPAAPPPPVMTERIAVDGPADLADKLVIGLDSDHPAVDSLAPVEPSRQLAKENKKKVAGEKASGLEQEKARERRLDAQGAIGGTQTFGAVTTHFATNASRTGAAAAFLAERETVTGLRFQEPRGYWLNTYIPGDPEARFLAARLRELDPTSPALAVRPYSRPYDAPEDAALAVYLHSDRAAIEGQTRALVEIGIKGALDRATRRPEMSVALVLDVREVPDAESQAAIRSLLTAFAQAREGGDRFSLTLAGAPGAMVVTPDDFRNGPLAVALDNAFRKTNTSGLARSAAPELDLAHALETAMISVARADDPKAPIGASSVVLLSARPIGPELTRLVKLAHTSAVNGVPLSMVAVGSEVPAAEVARLTLAGQGRRHLLARAGDAVALAGRELHAASRSVARAVRLRIRLAPGVKLVGIIGSHRLGKADVKRVKEAENSIDARLARSLGIEADRGRDEDGIQIVIPAFQAGDEHAVLLDVVVERPGPIADVTVRYKDLARLGNAVARANLSLPAGHVAAGPLERGVTRDLLAARVSERLAEAARLVRAGDPATAAIQIDECQMLVAELSGTVPGWSSDLEIQADRRLLTGFGEQLRTASDPALAQLLADALQLASLRKISPPFDQP